MFKEIQTRGASGYYPSDAPEGGAGYSLDNVKHSKGTIRGVGRHPSVTAASKIHEDGGDFSILVHHDNLTNSIMQTSEFLVEPPEHYDGDNWSKDKV